MLDECCQLAVINKVMIKVIVDEEGKHCKDDLVNGDVEVDV